MRRSRSGALVLHRYPERPCPVRHETWSGDYAAVKRFSAREITVFINTHTYDYLRLFCEHTPAMENYLAQSDFRGSQYRVNAAITDHFRDAGMWEGEADDEAEER